MKKLIFLGLLFSSLVWSDTTLLLVGGGKRPADAMQAYAKLAGGINSKILIIPWASESTEGAVNIRQELMLHPTGRVEIASPIKAELIKQLASATGVFFTGGDQNKLMQAMQDFSVKPLLKKMYAQGVAFAGTSAGTAIMSEKMLNGGGDLTVLNGSQIGISEGLGLLPSSVIVDQHFIVRSRFNRLAGVVLNTQYLGIAIDEDNALMITNGTEGTVFGPTQVLFFSPGNSKKLTIDVFEKNEKIDLKKYPAF